MGSLSMPQEEAPPGLSAHPLSRACIADAYPEAPVQGLVIPRRHVAKGWRCTSRDGPRWWHGIDCGQIL